MTAVLLTNAGAPDAVLSVDVPIRLQFVHSTVPSKVPCGVTHCRMPSETTSGTVVITEPFENGANGPVMFSEPLIF
jgi:hypothetical protein